MEDDKQMNIQSQYDDVKIVEDDIQIWDSVKGDFIECRMFYTQGIFSYTPEKYTLAGWGIFKDGRMGMGHCINGIWRMCSISLSDLPNVREDDLDEDDLDDDPVTDSLIRVIACRQAALKYYATQQF